MPCPGPDCDCVPCLRRSSFARWRLSDFSSLDGRYRDTPAAAGNGNYGLPKGEVVPGLREHGRKVLIPALGNE